MLGAGPAACGSQGEAGGLVLSVAREQGRCDAGLGTSAKHCYAPGVLAYLLRTLWGSLRAGRGLWWGCSAAWLGRARAPAADGSQGGGEAATSRAGVVDIVGDHQADGSLRRQGGQSIVALDV